MAPSIHGERGGSGGKDVGGGRRCEIGGRERSRDDACGHSRYQHRVVEITVAIKGY